MDEFSQWLRLVYGAGTRPPQPEAAEKMLRENPAFGEAAPYAAGSADGIRRNPQATTEMPPLVALTHSGLCRIRPADFEACAKQLIHDGADVNATWRNPEFPDFPLSALYGAAGKNHQPGLTKLLLDAGANPNDNESLYHAAEPRGIACVKLLLAAGAKVKGTNALHRSLDHDHLECTQLLLDAGADLSEGPAPALHWAIYRRRSTAHIKAILRAGADPSQLFHGLTPYRSAMFAGMEEAAAILRSRTSEAELQGVELFAARCTSGNAGAARAMLRERNWVAEIPQAMLRLLPDQAAAGRNDSVMLMVELGWPIAAKGGDWKASALNLAVFRGDAALTRFLLQHGASWEERHGYNDDVRGTLSWASYSRPSAHGDWLACAKALVDAGMPKPDDRYEFGADVAAYFAKVFS